MEKLKSVHQWLGGIFCFVCLFCFTGEILIVCADTDEETLDAADQHCRPHTDAHSDVFGTAQRPSVLWKLENETINISTLHCYI